MTNKFAEIASHMATALRHLYDDVAVLTQMHKAAVTKQAKQPAAVAKPVVAAVAKADRSAVRKPKAADTTGPVAVPAPRPTRRGARPARVRRGA
jgi:hypothetical protein